MAVIRWDGPKSEMALLTLRGVGLCDEMTFLEIERIIMARLYGQFLSLFLFSVFGTRNVNYYDGLVCDERTWFARRGILNFVEIWWKREGWESRYCINASHMTIINRVNVESLILIAMHIRVASPFSFTKMLPHAISTANLSNQFSRSNLHRSLAKRLANFIHFAPKRPNDEHRQISIINCVRHAHIESRTNRFLISFCCDDNNNNIVRHLFPSSPDDKFIYGSAVFSYYSELEAWALSMIEIENGYVVSCLTQSKPFSCYLRVCNATENILIFRAPFHHLKF